MKETKHTLPPPPTQNTPHSYAYAAVTLAQFRDRPDRAPVLRRLGFDAPLFTTLGIGGCIAVVGGFLLLFALNAYLALLPSRPRLSPLTK